MEDSLICRLCKEPVVKNREHYETFENMHWICFHIIFEHHGADKDEECRDPSCPMRWGRILDSLTSPDSWRFEAKGYVDVGLDEAVYQEAREAMGKPPLESGAF